MMYLMLTCIGDCNLIKREITQYQNPQLSKVKEGIQGVPWGHRVGLMSLQMIHEAYKPVYMWSKFFLRTNGLNILSN